jgi:ectoine hydroxylase-related dioxygenase (phytanoyl-CoA dioxygenase family)
VTRLPEFAAGTDAGLIGEALDEAGAVVVTGMLDASRREAVVADLAEPVAAARIITQDRPEAFYPGQTRRVIGLLARSKAVQRLTLDRRVHALCDRFLLPNCLRYQLHVASALVIGPGARSQMLHREDDGYPFFEVPRPHLVLATMWAMSPFTATNGATLIVPGSHRWTAGRQAQPNEVVSAEMPAGAMLVWLGGTLHGAGANTSAADWRYGVFVSYSLGWLRQEENQYLDVPPAVARELDDELRALAGFAMHGGLGFHDPELGVRQ